MATYNSTFKPLPWHASHPRYSREDSLITLRQLTNTPLAILDTETSGIDKRSQITEISIVDYHSGDILLNTLLKPQNIDETFDSSKASEVSSIKYAMLQDQPSFLDISDQLTTILSEYTISGWNVNFDAKMLLRDAFRHTILLPRFKTIDAMVLFQHFTRMADYSTLSEAMELCSLEWDGLAHRSLADVLSTIKVIRHMEQTALNYSERTF